MRWTAAGFAPAIISSEAVVWRKSWKRIFRTSARGQSFILHFGQRRSSASAACSEYPQLLLRHTWL
jgi:hypothetical protein